MRRHLTWLVPLMLLLVVPLGSAAILGALGDWYRRDPEAIGWAGMLGFATLVAATGATIACVVLAIRNGHRVFRSWRRSQGRYTKREQEANSVLAEAQRAWDAAVRLMQTVHAERLPEPIEVWGIIPRAGEMFFYEVDAQYQRFYGTVAQWTHQSGFYMGRPGFVFAGLVTDAVANSTAKAAALRAAAAQWREHQHTRILLSNQRLAIFANGQWMSFDFGTMSACYPDPDHWAVTYEFTASEPLRLVGKGAPLISVWSILATRGRAGVVDHPALARIRTALGTH